MPPPPPPPPPPSFDRFAVQVVPDRDRVLVVPEGDLDMATVPAVDAEVRRLWGDGFREVVVDLARVPFMDSSGLQTLLTLQQAADRDGHALRLRPGPRAVERVFELTATRGLFDWDGSLLS